VWLLTELSTCPCLWVGTSLGTVLVISLTLPTDAELRRREPVLVSPSGLYTHTNVTVAFITHKSKTSLYACRLFFSLCAKLNVRGVVKGVGDRSTCICGLAVEKRQYAERVYIRGSQNVGGTQLTSI